MQGTAKCDIKEEWSGKKKLMIHFTLFFLSVNKQRLVLENTQVTLSAQSIFLSLFRSMLVAEV